jgi:hypothetical protein
LKHADIYALKKALNKCESGDSACQQDAINAAFKKSIINDQKLLETCAENNEQCSKTMRMSIEYGANRSVDELGMKDDRLRSVGVNFYQAYSLPDGKGANYFNNRSSRNDFYTSMQDYAVARGSEVVWPQMAADVTAFYPLGLHNMLPGSDMNKLSLDVNKAIFNDAFPKLGVLYNQSPLTGQAGYEFDRGMVKLEQTTAQPYWSKINNPDFTIIGLGAGARMGLDNLLFGTESIGNLNDRINLGNKLIDKTRQELDMPELKK